MRKPVMAGNWKMYKTPADTKAFFEKFVPLVASSTHAEVVIYPPFVNIAAAVDAVKGSRVEVGGQNLHWGTKEGAFTGEISGPMLKASGAEWVIIGHSERRQFFGETDASVWKRTLAALESGLKPIVCVGEMLAEREAGETDVAIRILYGGSVKPDNVKGLMAQPEIDGALVGGASLEAGSFASIVNF